MKMIAAPLTSDTFHFSVVLHVYGNMLMFNCNIQVSDNGCTLVLSAAFARTFSTALKILKTTHYILKAKCFQNVV